MNVLNSKSGRNYFIIPTIDSNSYNQNYDDIAIICNQTEIYNELFSGMLGGKPYTTENAKGFLDWAKQGWKNNEYFVFVICDEEKNIVGCIDIKSNNKSESEIGFWLDKNHSGLMSNSLSEILKYGSDHNFKKFYADAKKENQKSISVLKRNNFTILGEIDGYLRFEKFL